MLLLLLLLHVTNVQLTFLSDAFIEKLQGTSCFGYSHADCTVTTTGEV